MWWWGKIDGIGGKWVKVTIGSELVVGHFASEAFHVDYVGVWRGFWSAEAFAWWDLCMQGDAAVVSRAVGGVLVQDVYTHDGDSDL